MNPTPEQLAARSAAAAGKTVTAPSSQDAFLETLQTRLMGAAGAISSQDTQIEKTIQESIASVKAGGEASKTAASSAFDRSITGAREAGADRLASTRESQRGFATNTAALDKLVADTDKNVKDLEQRKQESLLAGDAETYRRVSELQLQSIEYKQKAQQNYFNNLLGAGSFALNLAESKRQADQFSRSLSLQERSSMATLAAQFGVKIEDGDTIDTIATKIAPLASEKQRLEIERMTADIKRSKAETAAAMSKLNAEKALSAMDVKSLGAALRNGAIQLTDLKSTSQMSAVFKEAQNQTQADTLSNVRAKIKEGLPKEELVQLVVSDTGIPDKAAVFDMIEKEYASAPKKTPSVISGPKMAESAADFMANLFAGTGEFITGGDIPGFGSGR